MKIKIDKNKKWSDISDMELRFNAQIEVIKDLERSHSLIRKKLQRLEKENKKLEKIIEEDIEAKRIRNGDDFSKIHGYENQLRCKDNEINSYRQVASHFCELLLIAESIGTRLGFKISGEYNNNVLTIAKIYKKKGYRL